MNAAARALARLQRQLIFRLPVILGFGLVMMGTVPSGLPHFGIVAPMLSIAVIFYWSVYRPESLSPLGAFSIGLLQDILSGGLLGLMALILTVVHLVVVGQRRVFLSKSFAVGWWGFSVVVAAVLAVAWLVVSMVYGSAVAPLPVFVQFCLTVMTYPALNWLFNRTEALMLRQT